MFQVNEKTWARFLTWDTLSQTANALIIKPWLIHQINFKDRFVVFVYFYFAILKKSPKILVTFNVEDKYKIATNFLLVYVLPFSVPLKVQKACDVRSVSEYFLFFGLK